MSTHNICFHGEIRKKFHDTPSYLEVCSWINAVITLVSQGCKIPLARLHLQVNFKAERVRFSELSSLFLHV